MTRGLVLEGGFLAELVSRAAARVGGSFLLPQAGRLFFKKRSAFFL
jgi:hypothetical protein